MIDLRSILPAGLGIVASALALSACLQHGIPARAVPGPEADCAEACEKQATGCSEAACARGCRLVMDRLVEHEQRPILACVARTSKTACDDMTFADCAARTGPFADGGPAPPQPPSDD